MKERIIKAWTCINGHKTWILMTTATVLQQMQHYEIIPDSKGWNFAIGLTIAFGGGALGHKAKKAFRR